MTELPAPLPAQEIEAEIPQASLAGAEELQRKARFFARLPCLRLCRKKCAQKPNIKAKTACQPRMQSAVFVPKAEVETQFPGCRRGAH
jgi:hypothetical protein